MRPAQRRRAHQGAAQAQLPASLTRKHMSLCRYLPRILLLGCGHKNALAAPARTCPRAGGSVLALTCPRGRVAQCWQRNRSFAAEIAWSAGVGVIGLAIGRQRATCEACLLLAAEGPRVRARITSSQVQVVVAAAGMSVPFPLWCDVVAKGGLADSEVVPRASLGASWLGGWGRHAARNPLHDASGSPLVCGAPRKSPAAPARDPPLCQDRVLGGAWSAAWAGAVLRGRSELWDCM